MLIKMWSAEFGDGPLFHRYLELTVANHIFISIGGGGLQMQGGLSITEDGVQIETASRLSGLHLKGHLLGAIHRA